MAQYLTVTYAQVAFGEKIPTATASLYRQISRYSRLPGVMVAGWRRNNRLAPLAMLLISLLLFGQATVVLAAADLVPGSGLVLDLDLDLDLNLDKPSSHESQQALSRPLLLQAAVAMAVADNPGLAAMKFRAQALAAVPSQEGALPDPRLSLNMMNVPLDSFDFSQEPMTQLQLGISQMLPFPGKLALRVEAAKHDTASARRATDEMRLKLVRDVKIQWWHLYFTDRALEIVTRNRVLLRQFVAVAQTKYKVGKGLQQDVLLAQLELSKFHDKSINLRGMRRSQAARLNALLDQPADHLISLPQAVVETLAEINNEQALLALAATSRPLLAAHKSNIDAARARLGLAKKAYAPDFIIAANYGYRSGENSDGSDRADFFSLMLSMNVPLYAGARQDKRVDQRHSQILQQRQQLNEARRRVATEVSQALADYQRSREQASLFKQGIIPQAGQTVASMLAAYQVNKVDFLNLVQAQITLFNYETRYWQALSQGNQALARLMAAVGNEDFLTSSDHNSQ